MSEDGKGGKLLEFIRKNEPTNEVIEAEAHSLLKAIETPEWQTDPDSQVALFNRLRPSWPSFNEGHRIAIRQRVARTLTISPERFDFLVHMHDELELRQALDWTPDTLYQMQPDELIYPGPAEGWLGAYLHYSQYNHGHRAFHFWAGATVLGAACRRQFYLNIGSYRYLYPSMYTLLVGPSGCGKTEAVGRAAGVLEQANKLVLRRNVLLTQAPVVHILPNSCTRARMISTLLGKRRHVILHGDVGDPSTYESVGLFQADELMTLLGKKQYESSTMISTLTAMFDGRFEDSTEKRGDVQIHNIALSALFGSTMDWLKTDMDEGIFKGGFMGARCLLFNRGYTDRFRNKVYPRRAPSLDPVQKHALARVLADRMEHPPTEMKYTKEAEERFVEWGKEKDPDVGDDRVSSYLARRHIHLQKLAIVFAVSRHEEPWITLPALEWAIRIMAHEEQLMFPAFVSIVAPHQAQWLTMLEEEMTRLGNEIPLKTLMARAARILPNRQAIDDTLHLLKATGMAKIEVRGKGELWVVRSPIG